MDGQPIVTIAVPVRVAGEVRYALDIGLSTQYLSTFMDQYVCAGWVSSIIDTNGRLLARRPLLDGDELVGQPTISEVMAHIGDPGTLYQCSQVRRVFGSHGQVGSAASCNFGLTGNVSIM